MFDAGGVAVGTANIMKSTIVALLIALLANLTAADVLAQDPEWLVLDEVVVTFYGPGYVDSDVMASGIRYSPDNDTVALGPYHLALVRDYYDAQQPFRWWRNRDGELRYRAPAGCYAVLVTRTSVRWWGCMVRVCADAAGGERLCRWLRVADTGAVAIDLPDRTWERWGWPVEGGVFTGTLEVLR